MTDLKKLTDGELIAQAVAQIPFAQAVAEHVVNTLRENRLPRWFMQQMQPNFNFAYNIIMQGSNYARLEITVADDGSSLLIDFIKMNGQRIGRFRFYAADEDVSDGE